MVDDILRWQKEFRSGPEVWTVRVRGEDTGNLYDSEEAALQEVDFYHRQGHRNVVAYSIRVHSLKLSRERWGPRPVAESKDAVACEFAGVLECAEGET